MYYVIAEDGQRYGPVDLATLNQWAGDNRVVPTTTIESADGQRMPATSVPGIVFPAAPNAGYGAPGVGTAGTAYGNPGYGAPGTGASGYAPYPHSANMAFGDNGQKDVTNSYIAAAVGFLCCPIIPMIIGIVLAGKAVAKGNPGGNTARIVNIVLLCLQIVGLIARVATGL